MVSEGFHTTTTTALRMADGRWQEQYNPAPKKKTKKEELLEEIELSVRKAEARRAGIEAELAAAETERKVLLEEAGRAAAVPEFPQLSSVSADSIVTGLKKVLEEAKVVLEEAERAAVIPDFPQLSNGSAGGIVGLAAGGLAAVVAARSGLEGRRKKVEETKKAAIFKAAAEQDALNRAFAEDKAYSAKSSVRFNFFDYVIRVSKKEWSPVSFDFFNYVIRVDKRK